MSSTAPFPADFGDAYREHAADKRREQLARLGVHCAADFAGQEILPRAWLAADRLPARDITLLTGDGGTGKSLLSLQLAVACAIGGEWLGTMIEPGVALFLSAEDERSEIHRRLVSIHPDLSTLENLHIVSLAGQDALMASPVQGKIEPTQNFRTLELAIQAARANFLVLDTLADLFGGDEIKRNDARAFIGLLRGLCLKYDLTILLLSHPSVAGINSGTGTSGSTAWSNSVRSRLYFERSAAEGADPDLRTLTVKKSNYGPFGQKIDVRWRAGRFVLDGAGSDGAAGDRSADASFVRLLKQFETERRPVSHAPGPGYAPKVFSVHPEARGVSKQQFMRAMDRLLANGRIRIEEVGPPSRRTKRLVETAP
ncbi:MAG: AAA family ATPase [Rhodoblastus sp.]